MPHVVVGLALASCNPPAGKPAAQGAATESRPEAARGGDTSPPAQGWTRAEWLRAADGFIAKPATIPRLFDPETRPLFEKLVTTQAWLDIDWHIFEGEEPTEVMRFFPTTKKLMMVLRSMGAIDEMIALDSYVLDVFGAFIRSVTTFVAHLPEGDTTKAARREGIDKMRLGAAISVCGLLYLAIDGSEQYRAAAFDKLTRPASYSFLSREGLQLILATLDERLIASGPASLQKRYAEVRSVVAKAYQSRTESPSLRRVTYQGVGPPGLDMSKLGTVVSRTGKFSVELETGALASRVEVDQPDGSISVQHWIELQQGDSRFEAICLDGQTEPELVAQFTKMGLVAEQSQYPGHWLAMNKADKSVRMRILSIAGRGCVASVEGPPGEVPAARVQAFLASLRAAE